MQVRGTLGQAHDVFRQNSNITTSSLNSSTSNLGDHRGVMADLESQFWSDTESNSGKSAMFVKGLMTHSLSLRDLICQSGSDQMVGCCISSLVLSSLFRTISPVLLLLDEVQ